MLKSLGGPHALVRRYRGTESHTARGRGHLTEAAPGSHAALRRAKRVVGSGGELEAPELPAHQHFVSPSLQPQSPDGRLTSHGLQEEPGPDARAPGGSVAFTVPRGSGTPVT